MRRTSRAPVPVPTSDAVGYVRVSTADQAADDKVSLAQQEAAIRALAEQRGRQLGELFRDPGASGGSANRPGFQALLAHCAQHPRPASAPGEVLVYSDSRWGRFADPEEATYWRVHLKRCGWVVRFVVGDETEDVLGRGVLRFVHSSAASAYRFNVRETTKRGTKGTAEAGYWQSRAPLGYRRALVRPDGTAGRVLEEGERKPDGTRVRLVLGPEVEVDFIRWAMAQYAAGNVSLAELARLARGRFPDREWSRTAMHNLLRNPAYVGDLVWHRRPADPEERRTRAVRPESEWTVVRDAHPAIVSRETMAAVAAKLEANRQGARWRSSPYLLSGLLVCKHCGTPYTGSGGPRGPAEDPDRYRFYRHAGADREALMPARVRECPEHRGTLNKQHLEAAVVDALAEAFAAPAVAQAVEGYVDALLARDQAAPGAERRTLERRRAALLAQRARLVDALAEGTLLDSEAKPKLAALRAEVDALDAALHRTRFASRAASPVAALREELLALARDFRGVLAAVAPDTRRALLEAVVGTATVDRAQCRLELSARLVTSRTGAPGSP